MPVMLPISKGPAPRELSSAVRRIKGTPGATLSWSNLDAAERGATLRSLLDEQGHLCAYCMRRISEKNAHVEHIKPQSVGRGGDDPDSVDYTNLLAVCDGFAGSPAGLTCDRARGDAPLTVNPLCLETLEGIRYLRDGHITSDQDDIDDDLDERLNLNQDLLVRNRAAVARKLGGKLASVGERRGPGGVRSFCRHYIDEHLADASAREEFDGVVIYFMQKRLRSTV